MWLWHVVLDLMQVLLLGSAPMALAARDWPRAPFDHVVAINNAWGIRSDWDDTIYPWDFPEDRRPTPGPDQRLITQEDFVPTQNTYGGFVYAGGTMAYTAAYWILGALRPRTIAVFGCDMHYPATGPTHFYGTGTPDPLRTDITLRSLEAKSARLMILAAMQGCAVVNLSHGPSRLILPPAPPPPPPPHPPPPHNPHPHPPPPPPPCQRTPPPTTPPSPTSPCKPNAILITTSLQGGIGRRRTGST
jgi:hypothetical protein